MAHVDSTKYISQYQFSFISLFKFCLWNCSLQHNITKRKHYFYYQKRIALWCFQFMKYVRSATKWNIAWRDATIQLSFFLKIQSYCHIIKTKRTENKRRRISYIHCYCWVIFAQLHTVLDSFVHKICEILKFSFHLPLSTHVCIFLIYASFIIWMTLFTSFWVKWYLSNKKLCLKGWLANILLFYDYYYHKQHDSRIESRIFPKGREMKGWKSSIERNKIHPRRNVLWCKKQIFFYKNEKRTQDPAFEEDMNIFFILLLLHISSFWFCEHKRFYAMKKYITSNILNKNWPGKRTFNIIRLKLTYVYLY